MSIPDLQDLVLQLQTQISGLDYRITNKNFGSKIYQAKDTIASKGRFITGYKDDVVIMDAQDPTWRLWVGTADPATAPFRVDKAGKMYATGAEISGTIIADLGEIAGWQITATQIISPDDPNGFNIVLDSSDVSIDFGGNVKIQNTAIGGSDTGGMKIELLNSLRMKWNGTVTGDDSIAFESDDEANYFAFLYSTDVGAHLVESNVDIYLDASLKFYETGGGSDLITIQAPASIGSSYTLTLPTTDGSSGEFLQTNGSGVLSWASASAGANTALSNLSSVAINASLTPSSSDSINLGGSSNRWLDAYLGNIRMTNNEGDIYYNGNLALSMFATSVRLGSSTYVELSPSGNLSANLGGGDSTRKWGTIYVDTVRYGSLSPISDRRIKEDIVAIPLGLDDLMRIKPVRYVRNEKDVEKRTEYGFIAQEVYEAIPDFANDVGFEDKLASINIQYFIPLLVRSVQELSEKVKALESKI